MTPDLATLRDLMLKARQTTISRVQGCTVQGVPGEEADRAAWDAVWAELAKAEAEREALKDRVFLLSAELGYAPDSVSGALYADAMRAVLEAKPSKFAAPSTPSLRERRLAAEAAGWRALQGADQHD